MKISLDHIHHMDKHTFVDTLGWIFEHSPWIVEQAWEARPFLSWEHFIQECRNVVERSGFSEQLGLIRSHPDLAGKLKMTEASVKEQHSVGLDKLSQEEYEQFTSCNQAFKEKFGIPFIIAVRNHDKKSILSNLRKRMDGERDEEHALALEEIFKIAHFRLKGMIEDDTRMPEN